MSVTTRVVRAAPGRVWEVLADPWTYPLWVVGASRARRVDGDWPVVGSVLHHSVGAWPALLDDRTEVLDVREGEQLTLRARGWPIGEAVVDIRLHPHVGGASGAAGETEVVITEDATAGPGRLVPQPVRAPMLVWRNTETLRRLALLAERRTD